MLPNRKSWVAAVVGPIVVAVTFWFFFTTDSANESIHRAGYSFIILAEVLATGGFILLESWESRGAMLRSGVYGTLILYFVAAVIVSFLFLSMNAQSVLWLVTVQIVVLAVTAIIMVLLIAAGQSMSAKDSRTLDAANRVQQMAETVKLLGGNPQNQDYAGRLTEVYEAIKYCDSSVSVPTDDLISAKISALEVVLRENTVNKKEKLTAIIDEMLSLVQKRTLEAKNTHRGSI